MDIVLIGSGNVATVLGRMALRSGHRILQVYSPNISHAEQLAERLDGKFTNNIGSINREADLILLAIKDDAVPRFCEAFGETGSLMAHTAGALPIQVLNTCTEAFGVLYPIQSLRKEIELIPGVPFLIDGNTSLSTSRLKVFAHSVSDTVLEAGDDIRLKYHVSATVVNNFTNYLYKLAEDFCLQEKISFSLLQPLIEETALRLRADNPAGAQTGPALRNDQGTLNKHRGALSDYPSILLFYDLFTKEIQRTF